MKKEIQQKTIAQQLIEFSKSATMKQLKAINAEIIDLCEENKEDYTKHLELFDLIFRKLNPKKKVLDILLHEETKNKKIVLHQFGFFVLKEHYERATQMDMDDLFNFLKYNKPETFDKIAEEINYKHMRIAFRDYCKMINKFLNENNITGINGEIKPSITIPFIRKIERNIGQINAEKLVFEVESAGFDKGLKIQIKRKDSTNDYTIEDFDDWDALIVIEQIQNEVLEGATKVLSFMKENVKANRQEKLWNDLNKKFADFVVAEKL